MDVGIDSYCYHRLFGDVRVGETAADDRWALGPAQPLAHATACGAEWLFLETCFLDGPPADASFAGPELIAADTDVAVGAAIAIEPSDSATLAPQLGFSWGHGWPDGRAHGLHAGRRPEAVAELDTWIDAAARLGHPLLRITAGSPATRDGEPTAPLLDRLVPLLERAADRAASRRVTLALENHGDLRAREIVELLHRVNHPALGVCLDNVNLVRVGDDMIDATRLLAPHVRMVQLKDCLDGDPTVPGGPISTALGEGDVDLDGVLDALVDGGFDGPVCVELAALGPDPDDERDMVARSIDWLRDNLP